MAAVGVAGMGLLIIADVGAAGAEVPGVQAASRVKRMISERGIRLMGCL
jgi:hypothetical protein